MPLLALRYYHPHISSYCSYLGEVAGFLAGSVVSTTGGTVFSSSSATSGSAFRVTETAGSERSNGGHGKICDKIQQIYKVRAITAS